MALELSDFNLSDYIQDEQDVVEHLKVALEEYDLDTFYEVLSELAKSEGMAKVAQKMGVSRESLYKSLSGKTKPRFETISNLLKVLGFRLTVTEQVAA